VGRFLIRNFGCRATQAEGAALVASLRSHGYLPASELSQADLVILNTCTVTAAADQDVRQMVRRIHRQNPAAGILVTGCYAQRAPEELARLPGVVWVVGNSHKALIPDILAHTPPSAPCHERVRVGDVSAPRGFLAAPVADASGDRTRPNLKIQDGCGSRCSFCIIPSVRGPSRSAPPDWVVEQVRLLASRYCEVVLSGVNLGRWGREPGIRLRLDDLLGRLLDETPIQRIRLSSVEPMDLSDGLLALMASSPRIARHLHAPLQSGSDAVLKRMRRWYRARHYADRVRKARDWMPEAAIGADVMVGFPGETQEEFDQTHRFIESLPLSYLHVFTYSARPGTPAAQHPCQVPMRVRKTRNRALRELAARMNLDFRRRMIGRTLSVLTLDRPLTALSDNYLEVSLAFPREPNRLLDVEIDGLSPTGLREKDPLPVTRGRSFASSNP